MTASVDVCGVRRLINISCIVDYAHSVDACVGDWVLVHVGFTMSRIDAGANSGEAQDPHRTRRDAGRAGEHPRV
jgi:hydrogenase expression/formation protein HypC